VSSDPNHPGSPRPRPFTGGEFTRDSLFGGRLWVMQPRQGYRFSVDAVLLAHFISPPPSARVIDLGTGCGILPLLLSYRYPGLSGVAVEIQPRLAGLARENLIANNLEKRWRLVNHDFRRLAEVLPAGSCDFAVCNPPYRRAGASRCNPDPEKAMARHELRADSAAVSAALGHALGMGGRAALIYPDARRDELCSALKNVGLEPEKMQVVHGYPGGRGKLLLIEAVKGGGRELELLPPFYILEKRGGNFSAAMQRCYLP
jgi:tRNA1Val (adenine37-N6)-methyltransferase